MKYEFADYKVVTKQKWIFSFHPWKADIFYKGNYISSVERSNEAEVLTSSQYIIKDHINALQALKRITE